MYDRVACLIMESDGVLANVMTAYTPQVGCEWEEKGEFWEEVQVVQSMPQRESVVTETDFNGHGEGQNGGEEEVMGSYSLERRNAGGK